MIEIRAASVADAAAIATVHAQAHRETYPPLLGNVPYSGPDVATRLALWQEALAGPGATYVATDRGQVIGFGNVHGHRLTTLYILASHHRQGIGQALLRHLLAALGGRGIAEARFEVLAANAAAVAFYQAQGARCIGRKPGELPGDGEDLLFAIPTLPPGPFATPVT